MKEKNENLWHNMECERVTHALHTDAAKGLSGKDAATRRIKCGENAIWRVQKTSVAHALLGEFLDLTAILLIITALIAAVFQHGGEAVALIVILAFSGILRTAIYIIAHRIFEDAARTNIPYASVLRKGRVRHLPADSIVPGDILFFSVGDPVVADVRLLYGDLTVSELGVTANRTPQQKSAVAIHAHTTPLEERSNILFAGSTVIGGTARGGAFATGEQTYIFAKRGYISVPAGDDLPVLTRLSAWCRNVSLIMIAAVLLITLGGLFIGQSTVSADVLLLSALSLAVASMSEFLSVIAAIILAVSVQRLRAQNDGGTVIRAADAIESFGRARCLIFGDTRLFQSGEVSLHCICTDGRIKTHPSPDVSVEALPLLALSLLCRNGSLYPISSNMSASTDELTESVRAVYEKYDEAQRKELHIPSVTTAIHGKALHTVLTDSEDGPMCYVCGPLSDVLALCTTQRVGTETAPLGPIDRKELLDSFAAIDHPAVKTVAIATRLSPYNDLTRTSALHNKMTFLGFFAIMNPIDSSLANWAEQCRTGGNNLVVLLRDLEKEMPLVTEAGVATTETPLFSDVSQIEAFARALMRENVPSVGQTICVVATDGESREKVIRTICKYMPDAVYIGNTLRDIPFFSTASVSIASENLYAKTPQCLFSAADASVSVKGKRSSAAAEVFRILSAAKSALLHLRGAAEYLLTVQSLRLTLMLAAAFFHLPILHPTEILWCGLILDFLAVLNLAFIPPSADIFTKSEKCIDLPTWKNGLLFPLLSGVFVGFALSLLAIFASSRFDVNDTLPILYIGNVFTSIFAFIFCVADSSGFRSVRINVVLITYVLLLCITIFFAVHSANVVALLLSLIPCILFPLLKFIYRRINHS